MNHYEHPLSWETIGRVIVAGLITIAVWKVFNILILILISAMLATALYPVVMRLHKRLPLILSTLIVVLVLLVPFIIIGATVIPSINRESPALLRTLNGIVNNSPLIPPAVRNVDFTQYVQNVGQYLLQSTSALTNAVTSTLTLVFLTFYLIFDSKSLMKLGLSFFPKYKQKKVSSLLSELARVNGQYIRGNLIISVVCGLTIFIGLSILRVPFAAPLAIFAAILDLLPLIGAPIAMIPAVIIGLAISPLTAILVLALYIIYQQIENAFLAPMIYNKALKISAALSFLAVIIGAGLFGIIGAFLALPIAASLPAIITYVQENRINEGDTIKKSI